MTSHEKHGNSRLGIWFSIEIEDEEFVAFISAQALCDHFGASKNKSSQHAAYKENQKCIDAVARRKFIKGFPRPIKLCAIDFQNKTGISRPGKREAVSYQLSAVKNHSMKRSGTRSNPASDEL